MTTWLSASVFLLQRLQIIWELRRSVEMKQRNLAIVCHHRWKKCYLFWCHTKSQHRLQKHFFLWNSSKLLEETNKSEDTTEQGEICSSQTNHSSNWDGRSEMLTCFYLVWNECKISIYLLSILKVKPQKKLAEDQTTQRFSLYWSQCWWLKLKWNLRKYWLMQQ